MRTGGGGGVCKQLGRHNLERTHFLSRKFGTELVTIRAAFLYLFNLILVGVSNFCIRKLK
jgi:hypothetical protein